MVPQGGDLTGVVEELQRTVRALEARVAQQDSKLAQKNEVIAELMEENVRAKKSAGEP